MSKKERMFNWASCELSGFQKGFITIKIDFISNILSWKSAKQWNNNFVQGLPKAQMKPLYESLDKFLQENSDKKPTKIIQPEPYVWIIQYGMPDEIIELQGYDIDFDSWKELITAIEKVSRREFKL